MSSSKLTGDFGRCDTCGAPYLCDKGEDTAYGWCYEPECEGRVEIINWDQKVAMLEDRLEEIALALGPCPGNHERFTADDAARVRRAYRFAAGLEENA